MMQIFNSYRHIPAQAQGAVIAIGNFDGVHRGHQALLAAARKIADDGGKKLGVLTFEPHPRKLFRPDDPPFRITPEAVKARRLSECGVDYLFAVPFDWDFASQSAEKFIESVLKEGLAPAHIVVGYDFCFGQLRKGNSETLQAAGYNVSVIAEVQDDGEKTSSSRVRTALRHGKIGEANAVLGWDWEIEGPVTRGDQRGRELGFPTANMPLGETLHPAYGIYAAWVKVVDDGPEAPWLPSATNIGIRPMFELKIGQVEAHILDFNRDIYGCTLRIRPVQKLRGEAKFSSLEELTAQIGKDCETARAVLEQSKP